MRLKCDILKDGLTLCGGNRQGVDSSFVLTFANRIGLDGDTPAIGENGNWWIGGKDTGVKAQGPQGIQGLQGDPFTYEDFTPEQISELRRPATEAAQRADEAATKANEAAEAANTAREGIQTDLAGKADKVVPLSAGNLAGLTLKGDLSDSGIAPVNVARLDDNGEILPAQISPLQGRQTGVKTSNGYFSSTAPELLIEGSVTLEMTVIISRAPTVNTTVFKDNASGYPRLGLFVHRAGRFYVTLGGEITEIYKNLEIGKPYHMVLVANPEKNEGTVYMDGTVVVSDTDFSNDKEVNIFTIGPNSSEMPSPVTVCSCRLFNYSLTAEEVSELWNGGNPTGYLLPDSGTLKSGCAGEYLPCGLLPDRWRDTSGHSHDLAATGSLELNYQYVPDQNEVTVDTGVFTTNIASGVAGKSIAVPDGYAITRLSVWNGNSVTLTGVSAALNGTSIFTDKSVTTASPLLVVPTDGLDYKTTGNTLVLNATGNTAEGGMRIRVFCKWIGF